MNLFDLVATLKLDATSYEQGLTDAEKKGKTFGERAGSFLKGGVAVVTGMTTAVAGLSAAFVSGANKTAQYGDNVDKMSQKIGISAEAYQKWDYVMQRAGTSVDNLKMGMKTLSQQAEQNSEDFQKLGISQEEVANLSQEQLFEKTIKGLANMEEGTERAVLASKLLGRAGVDLGPLLNEGSEAIEEQMEIAEKYGMVMPESAVKASAAFEDSMTTMHMTMDGLKNRLMGDFLPSLTQVTDGLALVFTGDMSGADKIIEGVNGIIDGINQKLPKIMELGGKIVSGLAQAILQSAPQLFSEGTKLISDLIGKFVEKLPEIVSIGTDIIISVIDGLTESLPDLIDKIPQIIVSLVTALTENLPKIVESGGKILVSLVNGLITALPELIKQAPYIISQFVQAVISMLGSVLNAGSQIVSKLSEGVSNMWGSFKAKVADFVRQIPQTIKDGIAGMASIGADIVRGLWYGISGNLQWIKNLISGWIGNVKSFIKSLFGISSPSKWARDVIGDNIVKGLALGIENGEDTVQNAFDSILPDYDGDYTANLDRPSSTANGVSIVNYITVDGTENPEDFAERFVRQLKLDMRTV